MTQQTKTKPKCNKGTACGYACISGKKQCSEKILKRDADALLKQTGALAKSEKAVSVPADNKPSYYDGDYTKLGKDVSLAVPPDTVQIQFDVAGKMLDVNIYVNDSWDKEEAEVSSANSVKLAMKAMREVTKLVRDLPDGTVLHNIPYSEDGKGQDRAKLYERSGFGKMGGFDGEETGAQFAITKGGKLTPLKYEDAEAYLFDKRGK